jgi:hypothetical protein
VVAATLTASVACVATATAGARVQGAAAITLSSYRAGARPVAVTIAFSAELQCGRLAGAPVRLELPARSRVPRAVRSAAVIVDGRRASRVTVAGHVLEIGLPRPRGAICDVIAPGEAKIFITRAAAIGNPRAPGRYVFVVRHAGDVARGEANVRS